MLVMTEAAIDAVKAITLSDEEVKNLAQRAAREADNRHPIAPADSSYEKRLRRLLAPHTQRDGYHLNYKVYLTPEVNAFAMADGTVRVYSGLMDLMDDAELLFVIGHEIGHVVEEHSRQKVVMAYGSSALRKGLASQNNEIGQIARSIVGAFAQQLTNAQFSQREERQADRYGLAFLQAEGYDPTAAVSALNKLAVLAGQHSFLSSHPDPGKRAELVLKDDDGQKGKTVSMARTVLHAVQKLIVDAIGLVNSILNWIFS